MGHKVNPTGFRIGVIRDWEAKWYADKHYAEFLQEDLKIRKAIQARYSEASVSLVEIERQANQVQVTIHTARPGIVIGRGGQRVDETRRNLEKLIGKRIQLNIKEVQQPELDARLVARTIADQMEHRIAFRRAMKQAITRTLQAGAKGARVTCAGRLGGAEIARRLTMHEGRVPLHTLRADIDYGFVEAHTVMGLIGVKVWIYKGDILAKLPEVEVEEEAVAVVPAVAAEAKPAVEVAAVSLPAAEKPAEAVAVEPEKKPRARKTRAAATAEEKPAEAAVATTEVVAEPEKKPRAVRRPRAAATTEEKPAEAAVATTEVVAEPEKKPRAVRRPRATAAKTEEKPGEPEAEAKAKAKSPKE
ncbi:MAG: 30S ribosomal protein S3 [Chloroflexi bacterium]|nr:30S ribosomal protein S3 [Chloroflexota bacterium]